MRSKKYWVLIIVFTASILKFNFSFAQIELGNGGGGGYFAITSYSGIDVKNIYSLQFAIRDVSTNISNWSLSVRVNGPIQSGGNVLDPSKVSIRVNKIDGNISGSNPPSIEMVGANPHKIPLGFADVSIVTSSPFTIQNIHSNKQMYFWFDIIVEGGGYLEQLKNANYNMLLEFTLRGPGITKVEQKVIQMRIAPTGTPPVDPVYSIQVNSSASNGLLEFKSISDYVNGVSQTYANGLSVISSTPYALQVKAQSSAFESLDKSIPLNTVSLNLKATNSSSVAGTVELSNASQTIINSVINSGTQARAFDIRYFTSPNDTRLQNAKPDTYKTTLIYTMIPQ